jgi:hypothetical protein
MLQVRGSNWGLPPTAREATAITRPVAVRCMSDRLILLPERGTAQAPRVVPLSGAVRNALEPLLSELWKQMESWGIAGPGVYWRPILHVQVQPDAEDQFAQLQALLQGSGIDVQRRDP